jgi:serine/threonine protein kinase
LARARRIFDPAKANREGRALTLGTVSERNDIVSYAIPLQQGLEPYPGYRLSRFLGRGGWGEVWQASRPDGRSAALKFLLCDNSLASSQEIRALQTVRQLHHPHLIRIDQVWCFSGYIVIAMELAEGSLLDLLKLYLSELDLPIVAEQVCHYLAQAAQALDFLNTRQHFLEGRRVAIRHCDVKPSNLLLFGDKLKVADFSLSAEATSSMWYHRRAGTLDYTAPEVFQGRLSDRTDQYSLAVTYCQLRGGRLPFGDTPNTFQRGYVRPAPDLSMLSPAEQPILARALSPVPQDRWPSCVELITRLTRTLEQPAVENGPHKKRACLS